VADVRYRDVASPSRDDKIEAAGLLVGALSCAAGLFVVPDVCSVSGFEGVEERRRTPDPVSRPESVPFFMIRPVTPADLVGRND
jgi:hypothetical protein